MENLGKKVGFLNGLMEGMSFDTDSANGKLMAGIVGLLGDLSDRVEAIDELLEVLNDYVESIDEDLADLEADLYDDDDEEAAEEEDEEEPFESTIEYECPHCGHMITIDPDDVDFDEESLCPECGKDLFPELPDGAEEQDEEDGEDEEDEDREENDDE